MSHVASYHGYRFPPEIISHAVWLYHRFCLSFRDTEDLLAQRGITVSYAARAADVAGDRATARTHYAQLLKVAANGDRPGRPDLVQARRSVAP